MNKLFVVIGSLLASIAILLNFLSVKVDVPEPAFGGSPPGISAASSTQRTLTVGAGTVTLFNATTACVNRTIVVATSSLALFYGSSTFAFYNGQELVASTTYNFDSGLFGCGQWQAIGATASGTVQVIEFY